VRIVEQVLGVAPEAELVDTGAFAHDRRPPWKPDSASLVGLRATGYGLRAAVDGPAGALARAFLVRGYPVEQELAVVEAVQDAL
jgi:hypothetical protein